MVKVNKMYGDHSNSQKEKMKNAYPNKEFYFDHSSGQTIKEGLKGSILFKK